MQMQDPYGVQASTQSAPSVPRVQLEEPTSSPTVISTDSMREQLEQAQRDLDRIKAEQQAGETAVTETPTVEVTTPDTKDSDTEEVDPFQQQITQYQKDTNKLLEQRKNEFNRYMQRSDRLLRSQVSSIQKTFDERRNQAEEVASNAKRASQIMGSRTGRMRYAPEIQRGIITGQENALIETLATIDAQEAAAIAGAEQAAFNRDYGTFLDQIDSLDGIRKEREQTLNELQETMKKENEQRKEEAEQAKNETLVIEQIGLGITDPIEIFNTLNGNVPFDQIQEYTNTLPNEGVTEFEFIKGDKYNQAGYFDSATGKFVSIGGGVTVGSDGVSYSGPLTINDQVVGDVTPNTTLDEIDQLNISEAAKAYVRLFKEGRISQEEILQRIGGDKEDRRLRDEVIGVISRMEPPIIRDTKMDSYIEDQAKTARDNIEDILRIMNIEIREDGTWYSGAMFGTEASPVSRTLTSWIPGTDAKDVKTKLDTVNALIGFDALADMRAASPTGGALGQVTERELAFLQSVRGSLSMSQSNDEFFSTLKEVYESFQTLEKEGTQGTASAVPAYEARSNRDLLLGGDDSSEVSAGGVPSVLDGL
jgi:hypothetical protein